MTGPIAAAQPALSLILNPPVRVMAPADRWGRRVALLVLGCWVAALLGGFTTGVALLACLGFAAAVVGLARPGAGFVALGILAPLDPVMNTYLFTGGLLRWNTFNYWLLLVAALGVRHLLARRHPSLRLLQASLAVLALGLILSGDPVTGVLDVLGMTAALGLYVYLVRGASDPAHWYWMGLVAGLTGAAGGAVFFLERGRIAEINPNAWAFLPVTALIAIAFAVPAARQCGRRGTLLGLLGVANLGWTFLSGSRGSLLVAAVCFLAVLFQLRGIGRRTLVTLALALSGITLASQFTELQRHALGRVELLLDSGVSLRDRTSGRSLLATGAFRIFSRHPAFGAGTGGFPDAWHDLGLEENLGSWAEGRRKLAHAGWAKVLAENGATGTLLLAAFVLSFAWGARRAPRAFRVPVALVSVVLALELLSTEYQSKGLWFAAAAGMAAMTASRAGARPRERDG